MPVAPTPIDKDQIGQTGRNLASTVNERALDFDISTAASAAVWAHINDPVDAHDASAISVLDAAGHYENDEVEAVLDQVGDTFQAKNTAGVISACTYTTLGFVVTLDAGSTIILNGLEIDVGGQSTTLPGITLNNWVYINTSTGLLSNSTTIPLMSTGSLVLWGMDTNGAGVTAARDYRYFVVNTDRKNSITVKQGTTLAGTYDEKAECNFLSIDAALNYLSVRSLSSQETKTEIILRGDFTVSSTLTVPIDNITFKGDGCTITTGATVTVFDIGTKDSIIFKNITFECDNGGSVAIADTSGSSSNLIVDSCKFISGASNWLYCINLQETTSTSPRARVFNCYLAVGTLGITVSRPDHMIIENSTFVNGSGSASIAIRLGIAAVVANEAVCTVKGCTITGMNSYGIYVKGDDNKIVDTTIVGTGLSSGYGIYQIDTDRILIDNTSIRNVSVGVYSDSASTQTSINNCHIIATTCINMLSVESSVKNSFLDCYGNDGILAASSDFLCVNNTIKCSKTAWILADEPIAISTSSARPRILGCTIQDWYNTLGSDGAGIKLLAGTSEAEIKDCRISNCFIGTEAASGSTVTGIYISNCVYASCGPWTVYCSGASKVSIQNSEVSNPGNTVVLYLEYCGTISIVNNTLICNANAISGVEIVGADVANQRVYKTIISNNIIVGPTTYGIYLNNYLRNTVVSNNTLDGNQGASIDVTATGIYIDRAQDTEITGNVIYRCTNGIIAKGTGSASRIYNTNIVNNTIHHCAKATTPTETFETEGSKGIGIAWGSSITVKNNIIHDIGLLINDDTTTFYPSGVNVYAYGVYMVHAEYCDVSSNKIHTLSTKGIGTATSVKFQHWNTAVTYNNNKITQNTLDVADIGIDYRVEAGTTSAATSSVDNVTISDNKLSYISSYGIHVYVDCTIAESCVFRRSKIINNTISSSDVSILCETANYGALWDIGIQNNSITLTTNVDGIYVYAASANTKIFEKFNVDYNTIRSSSSTGYGIRLDVPKGWSIASAIGNQIYDFRYGINFQNTSGNIDKVTISNNTCVDMDGIGIQVAAVGTLTKCNILGNTLNGKTTNCTDLIKTYGGDLSTQITIANNNLNFASRSCILADFDRVYQLNIVDNTIQSDGINATLVGIKLTVYYNSNPTIRATRIAGNIIRTIGFHGIEIDASHGCGSIENLTIENNHIDTCATAVITGYALYFHYDGNSARDLTIRNNHIVDCNKTGTTGANIFCELTGSSVELFRWRVQGNNIYNCYGHGIYIYATDGQGFNHGQILDNIIDTVSLKGIYVDIADAGVTINGGVYQHICQNNQIVDATSDGIYYDFSGLDFIDAVTISNNQCISNGYCGIYINPGFGDTVGVSNNYSINIINNTCNENGIHGIQFDGEDITRNHSIYAMSVLGNITRDNNGSGIYIHHSGDTVASLMRDLNIANNTCYSNGASTRNCGLYLVLRGATENVSICNNMLVNNYDVGFRIYTGVADQEDGGGALVGAEAGTVSSIIWQGNTARDNATGSGTEDISSGGTNWPPANDGVNVHNIDSSSGGGGAWTNHDGAGWTIDNAKSIP